MYSREDFYICNFADLLPKFRPHYVDLFKFKDDKQAESADLFKHIMKLIDDGAVHNIFDVINAFFMFQDQYDIIEHRYLRRDKQGIIIETPEEMCERVASFVASAEPRDNVDNDDERKTGWDRMNKWHPTFLRRLLNFEVCPNTPTWSSAGIAGFGSMACCVVDQGDSLPEITKWYHDTIFLNRYSFGVGHSLHKVRPAGSPFGNARSSTKSSLKWLNIIQELSISMAQGNSGRGGANMVTIPIWHPDVMEFIDYKVYPEDQETPARDIMKHIMNCDLGVDVKETLIEIVDRSIPLKNFNMSVLINDKFMEAVKNNEDWEMTFELPDHSWKKTVKEKAKKIWDKICIGAVKSADPGILFFDRVNKDNYIKKSHGDIYCTNPCLTGDTIVATADGQSDKTIKELADIGKDVPVYCYDKGGKVTIRTMRHPRITGHNEDVYELELDSGDKIKATANHQFMLKNGEFKRLDELKNGDSLQLMTKFDNSLHKMFEGERSNMQLYRWIESNGYKRSEHRYIAEFFHGEIAPNHIVHHVDHDGQNNRPDNLEIMSKQDHDKLHAQDMMGDKNPMRRAKYEWSKEKWAEYSANMSKAVSGNLNGRYSGVTHEQIKEKAIELTKQLQRRFSRKEWQAFAKLHNIPVQFSKWRKDHLNGGIVGLAKWAALECGLDKFIDIDPRIVRRHHQMLNQGYDCDIINQQVIVHKNCEYCSNNFDIVSHYREAAFCSLKCSAKGRVVSQTTKNKACIDFAITIKKRHDKLRESQVKIYGDLKFKLQRDPMRKEWIIKCKELGISAEISRKSSPFKKFKDLKQAAVTYNHKVIGIKYIGKETVYNGTVDEFHGFFVGGFQNKSDDVNRSVSYVYNLNCGEIPLHKNSVCNLWTINLNKHVDYFHGKISWGKLRDSINIAVRMADNLVTVNEYPKEVPAIEEEEKKQRRIGIDYTGVADVLFVLGQKYGSKESLKTISELYKFMRDTCYKYSVKLAKAKGSFPLLRESEVKWSETNSPDIKKCPKCDSRVVHYDDYWQCTKCVYGNYKYLRNVAVMTQAPTGTRSRMLGVSFGVEPQFGKWWKSNVMEGKVVYNVSHMLDWYLRKLAKQHNVKVAKVIEIVESIENKNAIEVDGALLKDIDELMSSWVETYDITPSQHIKVQATAQQWIDQAVSKTINAPKGTTAKDVSDIYFEAWESGCKGITVYIDGSHYKQVIGAEEKCENEKCKSTNLLAIEGCVTCKECGWSKCSVA